MKCTSALSVKSNQNLNISRCLYFDPNSDGHIPWDDLHEKGGFSKSETKEKLDNVYGEMGVGVAAQTILQPGNTGNIEMCLVWDMPVVNFSEARRKYCKYYTKFFGTSDATLKIVDYALKEYNNWEKHIYAHQKKVLHDK